VKYTVVKGKLSQNNFAKVRDCSRVLLVWVGGVVYECRQMEKSVPYHMSGSTIWRGVV